MITPLLAIARNTLVESLRQPVILLITLICGLAIVMTTASTGFSLGLDETGEITGDNKMLLDLGLATVFVCGTLLAAFVATNALSREIENKTVLTVVSKPIGRSTLILGKYLGVAAALVLATLTMLLFLLLMIRHGVLSTAADEPDAPVIIFGLGAVFFSIALAAWTNFFYGWHFSQVASLALLPATALAYALVLCLSKKWEWQSPAVDFKPQVTTACAFLILAMLVLSSIAVAASTRLGQVMTIVVCMGFFVASLMSNYFVGRHAYRNAPVGQVERATPTPTSSPGLAKAGDTFTVRLRGDPRENLPPGSSFYYGPDPSGAGLVVPPFAPVGRAPGEFEDVLGRDRPSALIITKSDGRDLTVRNIGGTPVRVERPPEDGDFVFLTPTRVNAAALALWAVTPNLQHFWVLDAVTQNTPVPMSHALLALLYALALVGASLSLAVLLFQKRDVG